MSLKRGFPTRTSRAARASCPFSSADGTLPLLKMSVAAVAVCFYLLDSTAGKGKKGSKYTEILVQSCSSLDLQILLTGHKGMVLFFVSLLRVSSRNRKCNSCLTFY